MDSTVPKMSHSNLEVELAMNKHNLAASNSRMLLWVDAVGGFLVCRNASVTIGQSAPADIAIMGDISKKHTTIRRDSEGYLLTAHATTRVAGKVVQQSAILSDGDEIELGTSVVLRFRQPHTFSRSARLELLSHHRLQPSVDGVLLMADSCVLGPSPASHVVCRQWQGDVVLVNKNGQLHCHAYQPIEVDGETRSIPALLTRNSRIAGNDFCVSLEPIQ